MAFSEEGEKVHFLITESITTHHQCSQHVSHPLTFSRKYSARLSLSSKMFLHGCGEITGKQMTEGKKVTLFWINVWEKQILLIWSTRDGEGWGRVAVHLVRGSLKTWWY